MHDIEPKVCANDYANETLWEKEHNTKRKKAFGEFEEEESEESTCLQEGIKTWNLPSTDKFTDTNGVNARRKISIRPEVEDALGTLEKVISIVRQYGFNPQSRSSSFSNEESANMEESAVKNLAYAADSNVRLKVEVDIEAATRKLVENLEMTLDESRNSSDINDTRYEESNSFSMEVNHNKVVPAASPRQNVSIPLETNQIALSSYGSGTIKANGFHENGPNEVQKSRYRRKHWFCCFAFHST